MGQTIVAPEAVALSHNPYVVFINFYHLVFSCSGKSTLQSPQKGLQAVI
jgi:hypothetical protein